MADTLGNSLTCLVGDGQGLFRCNNNSRSDWSWVRPDQGWLKINTDGAVSSALMASCGGVLRDAEGRWHKGFSRNLGDIVTQNAFLAELLAVQTAVELVMSLDIPHIIVENDSLEVINCLEDGHTHGHQYAHIVQGILTLKAAHGSMLFQHTNREANLVADYLAKVGLNLPCGNHWFDSPFGECHGLLAKDLGSGGSQPTRAGSP